MAHLSRLFSEYYADHFTGYSTIHHKLQSKYYPGNNVRYEVLGLSEEGRPIYAYTVGRGEKKISLLAGAHSDEPVGPEFLYRLLMLLSDKSKTDPIRKLLAEYTFYVIPHINPDGAAKNMPWINHWPNLRKMLTHYFREEPGRDLEFGYPDMRVENLLVSDWLRENAPYDLHMSLHGMAFSEGAMLLIERHWIEDTSELQEGFRRIAQHHDLPLHDHNREGDKGFIYIGPGFSSTPEGKAMRKHFEQKGDFETAKKFHLSSMEFVRSLGDQPLCLVTELPLYVVTFSNKQRDSPPGIPEAYLELRDRLPQLHAKARKGESLDDQLEPFTLDPLPLNTALTIQVQTLSLALEQI